MLDLKDLRCFVAVYELQGFARAARELHTVQSNVSSRIARLERTVGGTLFERKHRSISPTPIANLLHPHAVRVLAGVRELEVAVGSREAV